MIPIKPVECGGGNREEPGWSTDKRMMARIGIQHEFCWNTAETQRIVKHLGLCDGCATVVLTCNYHRWRLNVAYERNRRYLPPRVRMLPRETARIVGDVLVLV